MRPGSSMQLRETTEDDGCLRDIAQAGLKEDNATNRAEWGKKLISYAGDPK